MRRAQQARRELEKPSDRPERHRSDVRAAPAVRGYHSFPKILDAAVDLATRMAGLLRGAFLPPFNAPLERIFTVVYWDQRGSG